MNFENIFHWDSEIETIDQWLAREREAKEKVKNPCCPYCGRIEDEWYEFMGLKDYEVDSYEMKCGKCDETYLVNKETRIRFESRKK